MIGSSMANPNGADEGPVKYSCERILIAWAEGRDKPSLDLYVVRGGVDGLHGAVGRLKPNTGAFVVNALEGYFAAILTPDGHLIAIVRGPGWFEKDDVSVINEVVNHRCAFDAEGEDIRLAANHVFGDGDSLVAIVAPAFGSGHGDWLAGGD